MTPGGSRVPLSWFLRHRLLLAASDFRGSSRTRRLASAALGAVAAAVLFWASWQAFHLLRAEESQPLAELALFLGLHTLFLFVVLRDAVAVPGHLLRAPDAALFGSAPVSAGRHFAYRLWESLLDSAGAGLQFGLPFVLGYAAASPYPGPACVAAAAGLFGLLAFSVCLLATGTLLVPRVFDRAGDGRRALLRVTAIVFLVGFLALLTRPGGETVAGTDLLGVASVVAAWETFSPSGWAGRCLAAAAEGTALPADALWSFALATLLLVFVLSRLTRRFDEARCRAAEGRRRRRSAGRRGFFRSLPFPRWRGAHFALLLVRRDALLILREPGMLLDLLTMAALLGLVPLLWQLDAGEISASPWSLVLAAVVGTELAYEVASRSLPLERRATHWIRAAPVATATECLARPVLGMAVGGVLALTIAATAPFLSVPVPAAGPLLAVLVLVLAAALLGWAGSLWFGEADWRHPRQMLRLPGRLLLLAVALSAATVAARLEPPGGAAAVPTGHLSSLYVFAGALVVGVLALLASMWLRRSLE